MDETILAWKEYFMKQVKPAHYELNMDNKHYHIIKVNISFIANRCPPVPILSNAVGNSVNAYFGTTVTYSCEMGFVFESKKKTENVLCGHDGLWSWSDVKAPNCQGELIIVTLFSQGNNSIVLFL